MVSLKLETPKVTLPDTEMGHRSEREVLLHSCCAPCSAAILETLLQHGFRPTVFYSNSNIYPHEEFLLRRNECCRYAAKHGVEIVIDEYNHEAWTCISEGLEMEPERGARCFECFKFRLERAARYAHENGYLFLTTSLASSRWKSLDQVNTAGKYACSLFPGVTWWPQNWRKGGLQSRRTEIIKEENFYNQHYCGCEFSLRDK